MLYAQYLTEIVHENDQGEELLFFLNGCRNTWTGEK